jgi:UDP-glucose 4-epimerase
MKKEKVVVTGGAGFIGSHVVDLLIENNYDVHVIDNLSTSKNNHFINNKAKYYIKDIKNFDDIKEIFINAKYVFHLAAYARVVPSIEDPITFHNENINGSLNIFLAAKEVGAKVIFSSSSSVYGNPIYLPVDESHPLNPMCPYALHKQVGEEYLTLFHKLFNLNSVSLRYFNVYGERAPTEGAYVPVVGIFFRQQKNNEPLTIVGDGLQKRDFIHVKDIARANLAAALDTKVGAFVYNVGSGKSISILDIANEISNNIIHIEDRFEPRNTESNISKIEKDLNWRPIIQLKNWINNYYENL